MSTSWHAWQALATDVSEEQPDRLDLALRFLQVWIDKSPGHWQQWVLEDEQGRLAQALPRVQAALKTVGLGDDDPDLLPRAIEAAVEGAAASLPDPGRTAALCYLGLFLGKRADGKTERGKRAAKALRMSYRTFTSPNDGGVYEGRYPRDWLISQIATRFADAGTQASSAPEAPTTLALVDDAQPLMSLGLSKAGIKYVYPDRETITEAGDPVARLREEFANHAHGDVYLMGVSLRVFFDPVGAFAHDIRALLADHDGVAMHALTSSPASHEVTERAKVEQPRLREGVTPRIVREISATAATVEEMAVEDGLAIELRHFSAAPYCTAVLFPEIGFFSPNILSEKAPVLLPLIEFASWSHGYKIVKASFDYLWSNAKPIVPAPQPC
jgi:hypothetical protein